MCRLLKPRVWNVILMVLVAFQGVIRSCSRTATFLPPTKQVSSSLTMLQFVNQVSIVPPVFIYYWSGQTPFKPLETWLPFQALPYCILQAVLELNRCRPVPNTAPMFSYMVQGTLMVVSQAQARVVLATALTAIGLNAKNYGFHTFRRSGASLAFSLNVQIQCFKAHGTWEFQCGMAILRPIALPYHPYHYPNRVPRGQLLNIGFGHVYFNLVNVTECF